MHNFTRIKGRPQYTRRQKGDMKQVPSSGPTNIWRHSTKISRPSDLTTRIGPRSYLKPKLTETAIPFEITITTIALTLGQNLTGY